MYCPDRARGKACLFLAVVLLALTGTPQALGSEDDEPALSGFEAASEWARVAHGFPEDQLMLDDDGQSGDGLYSNAGGTKIEMQIGGDGVPFAQRAFLLMADMTRRIFGATESATATGETSAPKVEVLLDPHTTVIIDSMNGARVEEPSSLEIVEDDEEENPPHDAVEIEEDDMVLHLPKLCPLCGSSLMCYFCCRLCSIRARAIACVHKCFLEKVHAESLKCLYGCRTSTPTSRRPLSCNLRPWTRTLEMPTSATWTWKRASANGMRTKTTPTTPATVSHTLQRLHRLRLCRSRLLLLPPPPSLGGRRTRAPGGEGSKSTCRPNRGGKPPTKPPASGAATRRR